jgi:cell division protein FtsW
MAGSRTGWPTSPTVARGAGSAPPSPKRPTSASWGQVGPSPSRTTLRSSESGYYLLLGLVGLLCLIGLVMVLSASSVNAQQSFGDPWYYFERQILWVALGAVAMGVAAHIDYHRLRWLAGPMMVIVVVGLLAVLIPGVGIQVNGSSRWLGVGSWRLQPSELAKLGMVLFTADFLTRRADRMRDVRFTLFPILMTLGALGALVMKQPDMGTTVVIVAITIAVVFIAGTPMAALAKVGIGLVTLGFVAGTVAPYRRARLLSFLHPFADASNTGYQVVQSYIGLGSGGLIGRGLGGGLEKWGLLPNPYTDFIFATIGEETGLLGTVLVITLFAGFAVLGVRAAVRSPDRYGTLLASGITAWIVVQALLNVGAVIGMLPITGVPLPFVSFGGSSLVIAMAAIGIMANVARQGR